MCRIYISNSYIYGGAMTRAGYSGQWHVQDIAETRNMQSPKSLEQHSEQIPWCCPNLQPLRKQLPSELEALQERQVTWCPAVHFPGAAQWRMIQMEADKASSRTGAQFLSQLPPHTPQLTPLPQLFSRQSSCRWALSISAVSSGAVGGQLYFLSPPIHAWKSNDCDLNSIYQHFSFNKSQ